MPAQRTRRLAGVRLFLSASIPSALRGPAAERAPALVTDLIGRLLAGGGTVICGGHPSITPLLDHLVRETAAEPEQVEVHQLRRFARGEGLEALGPFTWYGDAKGRQAIAGELRTMRELMLASATAAVFVGGETAEHSKTNPPGLREEFDLFRAAQPKAPAFLSGLLDGYVAEALIPDAQAGRIETWDGLGEKAQALLWGTDSVETFTGLILRALEVGRP